MFFARSLRTLVDLFISGFRMFLLRFTFTRNHCKDDLHFKENDEGKNTGESIEKKHKNSIT